MAEPARGLVLSRTCRVRSARKVAAQAPNFSKASASRAVPAFRSESEIHLTRDATAAAGVAAAVVAVVLDAGGGDGGGRVGTAAVAALLLLLLLLLSAVPQNACEAEAGE